jgi:hypothetical protein
MKAIRNYIERKYFQYSVMSVNLVLDPWEKVIFNTTILFVLAVFVYSSLWYIYIFFDSLLQ